MNINYAKLAEFCEAYKVNYNVLCMYVREAVALQLPSAPVGVEGLPQPFGYVEPRHDLSGYEVFDEPGPRRAAIWNLHGMQQALAQQPAACPACNDTGLIDESDDGQHGTRCYHAAQQPATVDWAFVERLADVLIANGWDVDPDCDGSGIAELRDAILAAQPGGSDNE